MRVLRGSILFGLVVAWSTASFAVVIGGDDFDGGTTNGGFVSTSQTLSPDNTANNGNWGGSFFDAFGIATIDIDGMGDSIDLPFFVVDQSLGSFPGDRAGIIPESKTDKQFVITDLENGDNVTSPMATASWDFDISNHNNLSVGLDLAAIGDFGTTAGNTDTFTFSYSIDGGAPQSLMVITSPDDNRAAPVTMADGNSYLTGGSNFFFDEDEFVLLGCLQGADNSCSLTDIDVFGDGSNLVRTDPMDVNKDGTIYADPIAGTFSDTPSNPADLSENAVRIYEETNGFGTFSNPEFDLYKNPLVINGDDNLTVPNQLTQFTAAVAGTGSTLTLTLNAEQYGGDEWFVFDNIVIDGTPVGGGVDGDFDNDGDYDCDDVDSLVADIANGNNTASFDLDGDGIVDTTDLDAWLLEAGEANIGPGRPYLDGDANLDGVVDVSDFNIWNGSKFSSTPAWCSGDFNADGVVDVSDFNIWNGNQFLSSDVSSVPEPNSLILLAFGFCGLLSLTRRKQS